MKMTTHLPTALLILTLGGPPLLSAAEEPEKKISDASVAGEIVAGPQWYAQEEPNDSAKFGEYRDVPNGFVLESLLLSWRPAGKRYLELAARDVGQLDQRLGLTAGRQDLWKFHFSWAENPRRWTDHANQLFTHQGDGV